MTSDVLHIQSAAQQYDDTPKQKRHDLAIQLARGAHLVGTSEVDTRDFRDLVRRVAKEHDYKVIAPKSDRGSITHEPILVRDDLSVTSMRFDEIVPAGTVGKHGPRGITTVRLKWMGNTVSLSWAHWFTDWDNPARREQNILLTQAMVRRVREDGRRLNLALWGGDINWDKDDPTNNLPAHILRKGGLRTIFADMGRPEMPTHGGRQIDLIGRFVGDGRVQPQKVDVHTDKEEFTFVDHFQVSAFYRIKRLES